MERVFWKVATGPPVLSDESTAWWGCVSILVVPRTGWDGSRPIWVGADIVMNTSGHYVAFNDTGTPGFAPNLP